METPAGGEEPPIIGIMGIEEKDAESEAIEFSLQVYGVPENSNACFYQIHKQISDNEFELIYESKFHNLMQQQTLSFDVCSISLPQLIVE